MFWCAVFDWGKRSLLLFSFLLFVIVFFIQPVQGASLIADPYSPDCNFTASVAQTRPNLNGDPTQVSIGIYLLDLVQLDEIRESFEAKFFMQLQWQDPRLAEQLQERSIPYCQIAMDDIWQPQAYVTNQLRLVREFDRTVLVNSKGTVTYRQIFDAELNSPLDFTKFPFDTQHLFLKIVSLVYKPEEVEFVANQQQNGVYDKLHFVGWSVVEALTRRGVAKIKLLQGSLPFFELEIEVKRQSIFLIWNSLFPLLIIVLAAYIVFWLEPIQIIPQVALTSVTLLSVITYQLDLSSRRPQVPYLTGEDIFLLGSIVLIALALVETIVTYKLAQGEHNSLGVSIDRGLRWLYPILLLGLILFSFL